MHCLVSGEGPSNVKRIAFLWIVPSNRHLPRCIHINALGPESAKVSPFTLFAAYGESKMKLPKIN